ncbi:unnamed protein product [Urochloa decumbens]|uniref:MATH domain-containing protein n=1 Tax=Urochloa decumbens TaxID=240449 RepID=A0ABC9AL28_9POAL
MTIDGFSKLKEASSSEDDIKGWNIKSDRFCAGGHTWYIDLHPSPSQDEDEDEDEDWMCVTLYPDPDLIIGDDDMVKVLYEADLLTRAGESVASAQSSFSFTSTGRHGVYMLEELNASPLLGDSFQVRCDLTIVVGEIAAVRPPDMHRHLGGLLARSAVMSRSMSAASSSPRTSASSPPGPRSSWPSSSALLGRTTRLPPPLTTWSRGCSRHCFHFIYTDTLPEVMNEGDDGDKLVMPLCLLVAAERYGMERLKFICEDIVCTHVREITAVAVLKLAEMHGCHRLKQVCIRILKDLLARVAP